MSFYCPNCRRNNSLVIGARLELPADARSDEITIQMVRCDECEFQGVAVYEESRRGGMDSESFDHRGYRLGQAELKRLNKLIAACPRPSDTKCTCSSHKELNHRTDYKQWIRLDGFELGEEFNMIIGR